MPAKKKLMISIASLCAIVFMMVSISVGVFAASEVTVTSSNISVTYTPIDVFATVSATYTTGGVSKDMTTDGTSTGYTSITFNEQSTGGTNTLIPQDATLYFDPNQLVTFTYTFTNNATSAPFTADVTLPSNLSNVEVLATSVTNTTDSTAVQETKYTESGASHIKFTVASSKTVEFTISYTRTNPKADASLTGNFSWVLKNSNISQ